tara:strand:- start:1343 stop:1939 length:597 start_codon:yes stop_codon:yes gene_type:complete
MGEYQKAEYYDNAYSKGDYDVSPSEMEMYYIVWTCAVEDIMNYIKYERPELDTIVDLGCGPGHFPLMLKDDNIKYFGYDFSIEAINKGKVSNWKDRKRKKFFLMDLEKDFPSHDNVIYCSFEFFEHIPFDMEILDRLNKGDVIFFSVPSFDTESHVRHFKDKDEVIKRYNKKLDVEITAIAEGQHGKQNIYLCKGIKK